MVSSVRIDRKRFPHFPAELKRSIRTNPSKTTADLAKDIAVSKITASRTVWIDLEMKYSVRRRNNILAARSRANRAERCPLLLNHLKNRGEHVRILVDGKKLVVDEVTNR